VPVNNAAILRAVFETNVFGAVAVYQAMLPLLREAPQERIVNVSSGAGSLTVHSDPALPYRSGFRPLYHASKTALNAMTLAMAIELEPTGIKVNAASPGPTRTNPTILSGTMVDIRAISVPARSHPSVFA
jgi:NAD(P)-dependent dehydrogenase (short-subunit alcohol dehydrogenase family)